MATDWAENVKKYVPDADDEAIKGIVKYCGIALQSKDASLVSISDKGECANVREKFLKKKLALTDDDATLDKAIQEVGAAMKAERQKNRVTVYYLLAKHYNKLDTFVKK